VQQELEPELLHLVGVNINWILEPVANCNRTGNHLGIQPHAFKEIVEFMCDDIEEYTGVRVNPPLNEKGHEVLFITPSGDAFADPGIYTFMGYLMLFEHIGLDYTLSTYASEGGNFGLFTSADMMQKLNAKMYAEANRLGCKWILGGECGHMWRVINQYMDTMNGYMQGPQMTTPRNPITGTVFGNAAATKMVHIAEFTADLIKHGKLKLNKSRNDYVRTTWHDSCNPARAMGMFEEPRYVLQNVCNHFYEMPPQTTREQTFCCAGGSGLNTDEFMEMRMRGGLPRGNALKWTVDNFGVNNMACVCAIDRATLVPLADYWASGVKISGLHELVGNALVGRLHGGMISATLDAVGALAIATAIAEKHGDEAAEQLGHRLGRVGTIDLRVDYLRPGTGKRFVAGGRVTRLGGRIASVQMTLEDDHGQLVATGAAAYVVS